MRRFCSVLLSLGMETVWALDGLSIEIIRIIMPYIVASSDIMREQEMDLQHVIL